MKSVRQNIIYILSWTLITLLLSSFQCADEETDVNYFDLVPIIYLNVQPELKQLKVGDTLWITAHIKDTFNTFYDNSMGESITQWDDYALKNFDFQTKLKLRRLTSNILTLSEQPGATQSFKYINIIGSVYVLNEDMGRFQFQYNSNTYTVKIGLIPLNSGVYSFYFSPPEYLDFSANKFGYGQGGNLNQGRYKTILYVINNLSRNNTDLFNKYCKFTLDILPVPFNIYYVEKGTYTFEVIE